jgi:hypothetical protein
MLVGSTQNLLHKLGPVDALGVFPDNTHSERTQPRNFFFQGVVTHAQTILLSKEKVKRLVIVKI